MKAFKQECIRLRRRDHTLPEIVRMTGRSKSSVHFHIRDMPLSFRKRESIRIAKVLQARKLAENRRGISARRFKKFDMWDRELVSLVAHLLFDGEIKHGGCVYNNRNMTLLDRVEKCMETIYPLEPKRYLNTVTGVSRISYFNVALGEYMREKSVELLKSIGHMSREHKREFLRSFFDDEGCMDYRPDRNHRRIRGYQKKVSVLEIVQAVLSDFDIGSRIQLPNEIVIVGKDDLLRFEQEIGFSAGVRINGNRSNSIWKKPLEKREILRRAILAYRPVGSNGVHRPSAR